MMYVGQTEKCVIGSNDPSWRKVFKVHLRHFLHVVISFVLCMFINPDHSKKQKVELHPGQKQQMKISVYDTATATVTDMNRIGSAIFSLSDLAEPGNEVL